MTENQSYSTETRRQASPRTTQSTTMRWATSALAILLPPDYWSACPVATAYFWNGLLNKIIGRHHDPTAASSPTKRTPATN